MMHRFLSLCLPASIFLAASSALSADHWNQFRGPRADGSATSTALPLQWSEQQNVAWKTALPGKAWSSPVVWEDQVWVSNASRDGKRLSAVGLDLATGKVLHDVLVFQIDKPMYCHPYNSYASSTPVIEQGRLWVHYGSAGTACVDTGSGKVLWKRQDFPCNHHRGPGSSPILDGDRLFIHFDGYDRQYVVALDKRTGTTLWNVPRTIDYGSDNGDVKKSYGTPLVIEHGGRRQLISPSSVATIAYDPKSGKELWTVYHGGFNAAARPLYRHGLVYLNLEGGKRLLAVRPDGRGNVTDSHIAWVCRKSTPTRPSQIIRGNYLYMVNDRGIVSCLDARSGKFQWTERMGGRHSASPILAGDRIYFFGEDGKMRVIRANPERYERLAENRLAAGCMASPAVAGNALLIRTKTHLYRVEAK